MSTAALERRLLRLSPARRRRILLFAYLLFDDPGLARALRIPRGRAHQLAGIGFALNRRTP